MKANAIGTVAGTQNQDEANESESENENDGVNGSESESENEKGGASAPIRTSRSGRQRARILTLQVTARDAATSQSEANASWIERTNEFDERHSAPIHRDCSLPGFAGCLLNDRMSVALGNTAVTSRMCVNHA